MSQAPWIGVDLDGTLAYYDSWKGASHIGDPVPQMLARVKAWLAEGTEVRIFTARVSNAEGNRATESVEEIRKAIQDWTEKHVGVRLRVTCEKDFGMVELWDDRCVQVQPNAGVPVHEFWRHRQ